MRAVYLKELKSYFNTLAAYVFIALVLLGAGAAFATYNIGGEITSLSFMTGSLQYVLFIITPVLTMRFASGLDRTLFSAPVTTGAIVAGRYFAALTVLLLSLAATLIYPLIAVVFGNPSWGEAAMGLMGLLLMGASLIAASMLVCSLTAKRSAAGALTLCVMLLILLAQAVIPGMSPWIKDVLLKATPSYHFSAFVSGVAGLSDAVYFLTASALLPYLSVRVINYRIRYR